MLVVDLQGPVGLPVIQVVERQMPPVMDRQHVVGRPVVHPAGHPADAVAKPPFHLHHMGDGMDRPGIARRQFDRVAAGILRPPEHVVLFQPEGLHAENVAIAGYGRVPLGQDARRAVAQQGGVADEEIDLMGDLKRQEVARVVQQHLSIKVARAVEVAVRPRSGGRDVAALPVVGGGHKPFGRLDAAAQFRLRRLFGRHQHERGAQAMAHDEIGVFFQRFVDRRERVGEEAVQEAQGMFEAVERAAVRSGDRLAVNILQSHGGRTPSKVQVHGTKLSFDCQLSVIGGVNGS
jgi:hypothetical protein